jgi:hypothetical protein
VTRLEETNLLVDVSALGGVRRADRDQRCGRVERGKRLLGQRMPGGKVIAVAEDGLERLRDGSGCGLPADKVLVDAEAFKPAMQPFGCARVA